MAGTEEIAALAVSLALDTGNFSKQMSAIQTAINNLSRNFKAAGQGIDDFENSISGLEQKIQMVQRQMELYNQKLAAQEQNFNRLKSTYDQQVVKLNEIEQSLGRGSQEWQQQAQLVQRNAQNLNNLQTAINGTQGRIANLNSVLETSQSSLDRLQRAANPSIFERMRSTFENMGNSMVTAGEKMKSFGEGLTKISGAVTLAVGLPLKNAIETGVEFEGAIAKVNSKLSDNQQAMNANKPVLDAMALKYAAQAGGASKVADAMDDLAAKGYTVQQMSSALPAILNAATASGEDLATASETVTGALETYNLSADHAGHVSDVLAKAANATGAGITDMKYAFQYAAQPANKFGVSLEQLSAMTGLLANQNIKGEAAGSALRDMFIRLTRPPAEAAQALDKLHVSTKNADGTMRDFPTILQNITDATKGMANGTKNALIQQIAGTTAYTAMLTLMSGSKNKNAKQSIDDLTKSLVDAGGSSKTAANLMMNTFPGALKQMQGSLDAMKINIEQGLAPILIVVAKQIQSWADAFNKLSPQTKQMIGVIALVIVALSAFATIIGTVIIAVGSFVSIIGKSILAIVEIPATIAKIQAAMLMMNPTILIVIGIIAALIAIGVLLYKNWDSIKAQAANFANYMKGVWSNISNWCIDAWNKVKSGTVSIFNSVVAFFRQWGPMILAIITGPIGILVYEIATHWNQIKSTAISVWNEIKSYISGVWSGIRSAVSSGASAVTSAVSSGFNAARNVAVSIWNSLKGEISAVWSGIRSAVSSAVSSVKSTIQSVWSGLTSILTAPFKAAQSTISGIIGGIKNTVGSIGSAIGSIFSAENPVFVSNPALSGGDGEGQPVISAMGIADSMANVQASVGGSDFSSGIYNGLSGAYSSLAGSTKADSQALLAGMRQQNKNLETQNNLLLQMVNMLAAGQNIAVNVDGRQVAMATSSYMNQELGRKVTSQSRAQGGK